LLFIEPVTNPFPSVLPIVHLSSEFCSGFWQSLTIRSVKSHFVSILALNYRYVSVDNDINFQCGGYSGCQMSPLWHTCLWWFIAAMGKLQTARSFIYMYCKHSCISIRDLMLT